MYIFEPRWPFTVTVGLVPSWTSETTLYNSPPSPTLTLTYTVVLSRTHCLTLPHLPPSDVVRFHTGVVLDGPSSLQSRPQTEMTGEGLSEGRDERLSFLLSSLEREVFPLKLVSHLRCYGFLNTEFVETIVVGSESFSWTSLTHILPTPSLISPKRRVEIRSLTGYFCLIFGFVRKEERQGAPFLLSYLRCRVIRKC